MGYEPVKPVVENDTVMGLASSAFAGVVVRVAQTLTEPSSSSVGIVIGTEMTAPGSRHVFMRELLSEKTTYCHYQ